MTIRLRNVSAITNGQTLASSTLSGGVASIGKQLRMDDTDDRTGGGRAPYSVTFTPRDTVDYTAATA